MKLAISGSIRPSLERKIIAASHFYADLLMDKRMVKNLIVDIEIVRNMDDNLGECYPEDECKKPRYFTIRLLRSSDEQILKALAHEFVHLKQYAKNELGYSMGTKSFIIEDPFTDDPRSYTLSLDFVWQGKVWKPKKRQCSYWDSPWEIEAYGKERGLFHRFIEHYNGKK